RDNTHIEVKFSGPFSVSEGDQISLSGAWTRHPKYGKQFTATGMIQELPFDAAGLEHYLASDPAFHGIGPAKAAKIAKAYGQNFDQTIRNHPESVAQLSGLKTEQILTIQQAWIQRAEVNTLATWLGAYGLTHRQITKIVDALGHTAKAILEGNPYELSRLLPGVGFVRSDEIAQKMGVTKEHPGRILACFDHVLRRAEQDGHCWMEEDDLLAEARKILCLDGLQSRQLIASCLESAVDDGHISRVDGGGRMVVALPALATCEMDIITTIMQHAEINAIATTTDEAYQVWDEITASAQLNESQRQASEFARTYQLSLIAGAAGSGKSYTIAAIYRAFHALERTIALAAPTGKAAKRMEELCGVEAKTIHRLLEYHPHFGWQRGAENPLDVDIVILDEISMCDVYLFRRVLDAIDWTRTRLVLVGDPNQLPPVGPGNILRDMLNRHVIPTTVLQQVIRQAGVLKDNSTAILRGEIRETAPGENGTLRPWYLVNDCRDERAVMEALGVIVTEKLPEMGVDNVHDVHILTPMNKGLLGTRALNIFLQQLIQQQRYGLTIPEVPVTRRPSFYRGDKVMQIRNNYDLDLMNGTIGMVDDIVTEQQHGKTVERLIFNFDGRMVALDRGSDDLDDLVLAYASTVHKAQGSEFPVVIAIMHRSQSFMLYRNLLYTAVTRSRRAAILLGDAAGMDRAIRRRDTSERKTFFNLVDLRAFTTKG
ncbi:MAG TPA: AAA family ATPase, partial [Armatimonadota bacterium]